MGNLYWLDQIQPFERSLVGDKAFYLSVLIQRGYPVVPGFVVSAQVFREFLENIHWLEPLFADLPNSSLHLDVDNPHQLQAIAQHIRQSIQATPLPEAWLSEIVTAAQTWQPSVLILRPSLTLASSVDPTLSHQTIGLLDTQLCWGEQEAIAHSIKQVWAELFRAKSLFYWQRSGVQPQDINFAILIQPLRSAIASGDLRTQELGWEVRSIWGMGQALVRGEASPDRYQLQSATGQVQHQQPGLQAYSYQILTQSERSMPSQPSPQPLFLSPDLHCLHPVPIESSQQRRSTLTAAQIQQLFHLARQVTAEVCSSLELEWILSEPAVAAEPTFYLTQVSPHSLNPLMTNPRTPRSAVAEEWGSAPLMPEHYSPGAIDRPLRAPLTASGADGSLLTGLAAASGQAFAPVWVMLESTDPPADLPTGVIVVAATIFPDWLMSLKQVSGIITEQGGATCHGAIIAREMGIPAVVGVADATHRLTDSEIVFLDGDRGLVYRLADAQIPADSAPLTQDSHSPSGLSGDTPPSVDTPPLDGHSHHSSPPATTAPFIKRQPQRLATQLWVNLSQTTLLPQIAQLPVDGIGLLRAELMMQAVWEQQHPAFWLRQGRQAELVDRVARQIIQFAEAFAPRPILYRSLDMRSHEYLHLEGNPASHELNPVLGIHGAFSYQIRTASFEMELAALRQVQQAGYDNVHLILPFVRTVEEFLFCQSRVVRAGLTSSPHFQLWIMAEVPSVLFLVPDYVKAGVQGISIGSNDLTQLLLGVDRDQCDLADVFDQRHPAVLRAIQQLIGLSRQAGIPCSICGQAPSRHLEMIEPLIRWGITSISVNPDVIEKAYEAIARAERRLIIDAARRSVNPDEA